MLIESTNELNLDEDMDFAILKDAMHDKGYTFDSLEGLTLIAAGTIKNILNGRVKRTSAQNLNKLCKVLGVPLEKVLRTEEIKKQIENQGIKDGDISVIALKEIYEKQQEIVKESNEKHIENIRTHYKQHTEDLKESCDNRIADKQKIIDLLTIENEKLQAQLEKKDKDMKTGNLIRNIIIGFFVCGVIALLVLEFIYLESGWLTFRRGY